jgi:protein TonB
LGDASTTNKAQTKESEVKKKADFKDLKLSDFGIAAVEPTPKKMARAPASESVKGMKNGDPLSQGLSATNDYVEEVTLGDFTHLNTVEYKFYGFYHRIRQKLEQFWGKSIQEKSEAIFRSGRRIPASENLITSLQVSLNENGEIVAVKILGASGVKELDDAAIESFNQAGPFPNPPKELLVNGRATIDWGFVVKS